ncbi:MAG: hypothetical protein ABF649_15400 [Bacillus sp. (in: firmicutes)]
MIQIVWMVYLGFLGIGVIGLLINGRYRTMLAKIDFCISVITWIGLFGYVTNNQFLTPFVWKFIFIGALLWHIFFSLNSKYYDGDRTLEEMPKAVRRIIFIMLLVIIAPLYYGLFRYAFIG